VPAHDREPLPEEFHELIEFSILASQRDPFDPMDKALKQLGDHFLAETEHIHNDWSLVHEYPLSRQLLALSRVWRSRERDDYVIAAKGAPEAIADLCHLEEEGVREIADRVTVMADAGLRVLGVARSRFARAALPAEQHDLDFEFIGLVGMEDPVRPLVPDAIRECYSAGIRVLMITGDYPGTARHVARRIGLADPERTITGPELDAIGEDELRRRIDSVNVYARVVPEQKLRLVEALKANGEIVAMTGDGVNDAPALKAAHIGIAMGERGTDVAREASALVLLDDDFSSIVKAVRMGRRIWDNLKKATAYIFAIHVPIAGLSLIPVLLKWPLVLFPVHILFLELIIDPACSIVFEAEPEEAGVMRRPPRKTNDPMFGNHAFRMSVLQGLVVLIIALGLYAFILKLGGGELKARAMAYTTLIVSNIGLILTNRSWTRTILSMLRSPNPALWWVIGGAAAFLGVVLVIPFARDLFRFNPLHVYDIALCLLAGLLSIAWFEGFKLMVQRRGSTGRGATVWISSKEDR
jgi:Ca2+-transporting ATPase